MKLNLDSYQYLLSKYLRIRFGIGILLIFVFVSQCSIPKEGKEVIKKQIIPINNGNLFVLTNDCHLKSNLLVLIHGSPGNSSDFSLYLEDEDYQKRYCIIVPDRLGYGNSLQKEFVPSLTIQASAIVEMVIAFLLQEKKSFVSIELLGHSYGGPVALVSILELQKRGYKNGKLIMVSAPIDPKYEELRFYNHLAKIPFIEIILPQSFVRSNLEMFSLKKDLEQLGNELKGNGFPVVSIHGDEDGIVPVENVYYLENIFFQGNHKIYPLIGGSHFIPWTRYSEIKSILLQEETK
ncbi:alpha/beta fold hydrolase [Leptospira sp. WS39.C2]